MGSLNAVNNQTAADICAFELIKPVRATYLATYTVQTTIHVNDLKCLIKLHIFDGN